MVVAANVPQNQYTGTGGTNTYPFTFPVFQSSQVLVTVTEDAGVTTLVIGTDYLVSGLNASGDPASAGSITLVNSGQSWLTAGNLSTGVLLTIQSNFAYEQTTSIRNQGDFYRSALENALDKIVYQIQQIQLASNADTVTLTDTVTGSRYQLLMVNGVLSTQQVS